jgi:hypothetical protein
VRAEWESAGWGARTVFAIAAVYWVAMVLLFLLSVRFAGSLGEIGVVAGFYFVPLFYAAIVRLVFSVVSRRDPPPRIWSWWLLVIGALLGLLITVARVAMTSVVA